MEIAVDVNYIMYLAQVRPLFAFWYLIAEGGWIIISAVFLILAIFFARFAWLMSRQGKYASKWEYVLLAIDVPKVNEKGPKVMESVFNTIAGAYATPSFPEKWWQGKFQEPFSFEIISQGGYIQFLVHTTKHFRNLVESAIYGQYPDAEIVEIEDYTSFAPDAFPDEEYHLWASEVTQIKHYAYPIRTYRDFEDPVEEIKVERKFKDPLAALMEVMARLRPGENMWSQLIVSPGLGQWTEGSKAVAAKLLGRKAAAKKPGFLRSELGRWIIDLWYVLFAVLGMDEASAEPDARPNLSGGEKNVVDAIEEKATKTGFLSTLRFCYVARHEVKNNALGVSGYFGALRQYQVEGMNGFKPHKRWTTKAVYGNVKKRIERKQRKIMADYKARAVSPDSYYLNTEELANLYHFPTSQVRNTMIKTADLKRLGAPISLPTTDFGEEAQMVEELVDPTAPVSNRPLPKAPSSHETDPEPEGTPQEPSSPLNLPVVK